MPKTKREGLRSGGSWESEAAGSCFGQFVVGVCYECGCGGVAQDYPEAVRLYSLAAAQVDAGAQNNLGGMFYKGP